MNYSCYIFDFDYTLVNSEDGIIGCFIETMKDFQLPIRDRDAIRATIGMPIEDAITLLTGLTGNRMESFLNTYRRHADTMMTPNTHFFPDTIDTLKRIKNDGGIIAIVSTKTRNRINEKFVQDGYDHLIDIIIGREDITACKPDPQGINMALDKLNMQRSQAIYIGDSIYDAGAAQNAGISFAAVLTGTTDRQQFSAYPSVQMMSALSELK
ncbi:MAG: HAD-IA family hydrolase [Selenomonadaceae bacterium]|nr:HAD-IA family hydrolase [Selenomonadaceae bacterium]